MVNTRVKPLTVGRVIRVKTLGTTMKGAALVLCLILVAGGIAIVSQTLVPPVFGVRVESLIMPNTGTGPVPGHNSTSGTLVVAVTSSLNLSGGLFAQPYVSGVGVAVVPTAVAPLYPVTYVTNSTGELQLSLAPSNYSVTFFDLPMNVSVPVQVHDKTTTRLQLAITDDSYRASFLSLPSNQTNVVPAWSHGTLEVASPVALLGATAAFLDLSYGSAVKQVPVLIGASYAPPSSSTPEQWISFQPETSVAVEGLTTVGLSVYGVFANVTVYGSPNIGGALTAT